MKLNLEGLTFSTQRDDTEKTIVKIIKAVNKFDKHGDIKKLFTEGYCYDFAIMLWRSSPGSRMFYDKKLRHYLTEYKGRYYDITGEVNSVKVEDLIEDDYVIQDGTFDEKCRTHL
jgi:hypothetical protein